MEDRYLLVLVRGMGTNKYRSFIHFALAKYQ